MHVDVDQFVVAVELRRRAELRGRAVIVGAEGDPTRRGVVSSASYEARAFGIDSGVALRTAARRCPDAVFLPLDLPAYRAAAREVEKVLRSVPGMWEVAGWDEAFLEPKTDDPRALAAAIQRRLVEATGLACSVGIGDNKLQAKVASRLAKPGGVVRLDSASWPAAIGPLKPEVLVGIGPRRQRRLRALGIEHVSDLAAADERSLERAFGPRVGSWLRRLARGEDDAPLVPRRPARRSHGRERTFDADLDDPNAVRRAVLELARAVSRDLRRRHRLAVEVAVTLRFAPFDTHSHSVHATSPSADAPVLAAAALQALERFELDRPVRLVGVRTTLAPPQPRARRRSREPQAAHLPSILGQDDPGAGKAPRQAFSSRAA
jgi:DNA polymerase-4